MRLIDADAMKDTNDNVIAVIDPETKSKYWISLNDYINAQPTVDTIKHGHWIWTRNYTWHCSECGVLIATPGYMPTKDELPKRYRFCSQCGAKMDEVTE